MLMRQLPFWSFLTFAVGTGQARPPRHSCYSAGAFSAGSFFLSSDLKSKPPSSEPFFLSASSSASSSLVPMIRSASWHWIPTVRLVWLPKLKSCKANRQVRLSFLWMIQPATTPSLSIPVRVAHYRLTMSRQNALLSKGRECLSLSWSSRLMPPFTV